MSNRAAITVLVSMMVSAVLFGIGAVAVLSIPALEAYAETLLPAVIAVSFILAPVLGWIIAPHLRARAVRAAHRAERDLQPRA